MAPDIVIRLARHPKFPRLPLWYADPDRIARINSRDSARERLVREAAVLGHQGYVDAVWSLREAFQDVRTADMTRIWRHVPPRAA